MLAHRTLTRHILMAAVLVPLLVACAVLMFTWPAARLQPRNLPVGVVETTATPLDRVLDAGDAFDVQHYTDAGAARAAITDRDVYGAFEPTDTGLTVYVSTAAGATVAQQLQTMAAGFAAGSGSAPAPIVDVVPASAEDPRGAVLTSAVLPLVFGGEIIAVVVALLIGVRSARRQVLALTVASAATGLATYAIAQGWLGALPHQPLATWGALALMLLAISTTAAGLFAMLGVGGIAVAGATMIFLGNPFSGVTSAPELLPEPAGRLGQLLPPGAGGTLLRATAYFDGHGAIGPVGVLVTWTALGVAGIVAGHRRALHRTGEVRDTGRHAALEAVA